MRFGRRVRTRRRISPTERGAAVSGIAPTPAAAAAEDGATSLRLSFSSSTTSGRFARSAVSISKATGSQ